MRLQMSCNTRVVRLEWEVLNSLHTVPLFFKAVFLFKAAVFFCFFGDPCVCHSTSLSVVTRCWSAYWDSWLSMQMACHRSDTMKRPAVDKTCKNSTKRKQTERLMSPLWRCMRVPGGFALTGVMCLHQHLVKQHYIKAAHLYTIEMERSKMSSQVERLSVYLCCLPLPFNLL